MPSGIAWKGGFEIGWLAGLNYTSNFLYYFFKELIVGGATNPVGLSRTETLSVRGKEAAISKILELYNDKKFGVFTSTIAEIC